MESTCTICHSSTAKPCGRCHSARYCSLECQQTDWPSHSLLCSQYSTHTGRPDPFYKRAILFPPNENKPQFIWVECKTIVSDEDPDFPYEFESSQVEDHLGGKVGQYYAVAEKRLIQRNVLRDRDYANTLQVVWRETFGIDGSQLNKSVVRATRDAAVMSWAGPIIALRMKGSGLAPSHYMDIDMQDYRNVVDYLITYANESVKDEELGPDRNRKLRGVKIHCKGVQRTFGTEVYSAVDVPKDHPIFHDPIAPISQLVGTPIHTRKYPRDKLWKDNLFNPTENVPATFLHLVADPSDNWWGWAPMSWQNNVGNVLVVRSDGQDVTTRQVEALSRFCQFKMQPLFENALGGGFVEMTREEVMRYLAPRVFEEFMENMEEFMKNLDESKGEEDGDEL